MRKSKKENNKSLGLAVYFGLLVLLIIVVSVAFKIFDVIRSSKFDGKNRFTVAVISADHVDLLSVSPEDGTLTKLGVDGARSVDSLRSSSVPIDAHINSNSEQDISAKSYFSKSIFNMGKNKTNLSIIDLIRLSLFSSGVSGDKIVDQSVNLKDIKKLSDYAGTLFIDPKIDDEKISVQITNSADVPGLGNNLARYISNIGGNVVLVNTSQNPEEKSHLYYKEETYTLKKLSKALKLKPEKKDIGSISDILIIIGKDKQNPLEQ